ncbi:hypothetical protein J2Z76_001286 [Sedimentibacter acidaminivorans]|uniref:Uncharacterized protein n=1 Tax=Sedimentibacter acidaminivorans TaxID=913099 RepID=A0ABS4GCN9_9FIRM|nr:hypothetical protein [Sedimentibacter acidaminivorans]MBP1925427.1 hypothetical protein [Sedimentibacter acidaminivorans]
MFDEFINNMPENTYTYEREINIKNIDDKLINSINDDIFKGEDVIKNIVINFTDELNIKAIITVDKFLDNDEINNLKSDIAKIFEIDTGNVEINI